MSLVEDVAGMIHPGCAKCLRILRNSGNLMLALLALQCASAAVAAAANAPQPHLLLVLGDDLGFHDTAIYNPTSPTPHLKALADEGIRLDRHYVFRYCSPTRRSMLSGRMVNHITSVQPDGSNLCSDFLPLACTILSEKLSGVGYESHFVGKGHLGYETMDHLPVNRGFKSHVGFLSGSQSYYWGCDKGGGACNSDPETPGHDMWHDLLPGTDVVSEMYYSANYYTDRAVSIIANHSAALRAAPLFMYLPYQNVHSPNQEPAPWETNEYPAWSPGRGQESTMQIYANMLDMLDSGLGNVTAALKHAGYWNNTLLVFSADNGGIGALGNNYPLRGHKHDPWEGGTRATAFVTGGVVPAGLRGTNSGAKLVHISDWYPTFCLLAGADPVDDAMLGGKLRPIDGVDVWPLLTGANATQPRALTPTTEVSIIDAQDSITWWKLITLAGESGYYTPNATQLAGNAYSDTSCLESCQNDPAQPGRTDGIVNGMPSVKGTACPVCNSTHPCLYDVLADPSERSNVAAANPDVVARLAPVLQRYNDEQYVSGHLPASTLQQKYTKLPKDHWGTFSGPCYARKEAAPPPAVARP